MLALDLNQTLSQINSIAGLIDVRQLVREASEHMLITPQSFIASDFLQIVPAQSSSQAKEGGPLDDFEALCSQNEYFRRRWWELKRLDHCLEIECCLIS